MSNLFGDAEFWVLIAFIVFIILVGRKAKSAIDSSLDKRANDIKEKIESTEAALFDAQKLLKNSQNLLMEHNNSSENLIKEQKLNAENNSKNYLDNIDNEIKRKKLTAIKEIEFLHSNASLKIQEQISQVCINSIEDILSNDFKPSNKDTLINNFIDDIPSALSYFKK